MLTKAQKLKHKEAQETAEIQILSGRESVSRDFVVRRYARMLRDTGKIPVHVEMYRNQFEENIIIEPPPKKIEPSDTELFELQERWGQL